MANGIKTGGRQKGTPNKTTNEIREKYQLLITESLEQLSEDIKTLEPKDRLKVIIELSKFVIPTLKATELTTDINTDVFNPVIIALNGTSQNK
jgi:hypothetical protein